MHFPVLTIHVDTGDCASQPCQNNGSDQLQLM